VDIAFDDDTMLTGVRRLMLLSVGDTPLLPPFGDCRRCVLDREDWDNHDWVESAPGFTLCKVCGTRHRVNKATHTEEWGDSERVELCDDCSD